MAVSERTFPDYDNPPVVETFLGVQFAPLTKFSLLHFGLYWAKIRDEFPSFQVQPPLGATIEQFGVGLFAQPRVGVELVSQPEIRCWFIDKTGAKLNQVQKDRFIHNWRKPKPDDKYVHYENIRPRFSNEWERFCAFLDEAELGKPEVNQCEMAYINHIEQGKGWESFADLNRVIAPWSGRCSNEFLPALESASIEARYLFPEQKGRLHIEVQPAIRQSDGKEILQLNMTARGKPESSEIKHILEWLDLGHEWIVKGFTGFTTDFMHNEWRRKT